MRTALFLAVPFLAGPVIGQTGTNTDCAHAIPLAVSPTNVATALIPVDGRSIVSGLPDPVTACSGSGNTVRAWYTFTATATAHWIRTEGGGTDDASMEVFSGSCGSLVSMGCYAPNGPTPALTGLTIGNAYYVRVQMNSNGVCDANPSLCLLWIAVVSAPLNDECAGAIELPVVEGAVGVYPGTEISTLAATQSQAACLGGAAASDDDVWYRFTATNTNHFFPTTGIYSGAAQTIVREWFSGTCGNLTSILCNGDRKSGLVPGTQYFIRVHSQSLDHDVKVRAVGDVFAPAPNDECAGALPIEVPDEGDLPKPVDISTINCTSSTVPCGTAAADAWLSFSAPDADVVVVSQVNSGTAVYSGGCGSLSCVSTGIASPNHLYTGLTPGAEYFLKVGMDASSSANSKVWLFRPALNESCATAIDVPVQSDPVAFTTGHTYNTPGQAWYSFTATATRLVLEAYATNSEGQINATAYSGTCSGLTSIVSQNGLATPMIMTGLTVGQQYHVKIAPLSKLAFRMAVRVPVANDECDGAIALPFSSLADVGALDRTMSTLAADGTGGCSPTRDVWYRFTAAHTSAGFVGVIPAGGLATATVELFSGSCASLTSLGCTTGTWPVKATFTGLTVGTEYHIRLSALITVPFTPMLFDEPVNDEIGGALAAPFGSSFAMPLTQAWNFGATQSMPTNCPVGTPDDDTWFTFTASATGHVITALQQNAYFSETALTYGFRIEIYDTLSTDAAVLAAHVISCGDSPRALAGLTVGKQYWYRAYQLEQGAAKTSGFATSVSATNNDDASGAMPLTYGTDYAASFNTNGATQSLPGADCQVDDFADDDVWFTFTATDSPARLVVGYPTADVSIELFSGTPSSLISIACDGNILVLPTLTGGQTYYARVNSWKDATPVSGRIGLFITPSLTANSLVDEACLGPLLLSNPSIEQGPECLVDIPEVASTGGLGTQLAPGWPRMQYGSSDGYSSCSNYDDKTEVPAIGLTGGQQRVLSRSGKGMAGIFMKDDGSFSYTEYIQAPLSEPLVPGEPYLVSFHVAAHPEQLCLSGMGAVLTEGPIVWGSGDPLAIAPDVMATDVLDAVGWMTISGVVVPSSPVDHITIGAFQGQGQVSFVGAYASAAYYFIDDVVVAHILDANCITGIGDVLPLDEPSSAGGDDLRVYPNPAADRVSIVCDAGFFAKRGVIEVFDATGSLLYAEQVASLNALQPLNLPSAAQEGLYLVLVRVEGQVPRSARVIIKR